MRNCILFSFEGKSAKILDAKGNVISFRQHPEFKRFSIRIPNNEQFADCSVFGNFLTKIEVENTARGMIKLPPQERNPTRLEFSHFENRVGHSSPAAMNRHTGKFIYNEKFLTMPWIDRLFIFNHEKGHFFYNTEKFCDLYATKQIIDMGFGVQQCLDSMKRSLRDTSVNNQRKQYVESVLMNTYGRK